MERKRKLEQEPEPEPEQKPEQKPEQEPEQKRIKKVSFRCEEGEPDDDEKTYCYLSATSNHWQFGVPEKLWVLVDTVGYNVELSEVFDSYMERPQKYPEVWGEIKQEE